MKEKDLKRCEGFTLIEIMIVAAIIGIMSTALFTLSGGFVSENRLDAASRQLAGDIRYVQQLAYKHEYAFYKIRFYPDKNEYRMYLNRGDSLNYEIIDLPQGINLVKTSFNNHILRLNARGTVVSGGTIFLEDRDENLREIRITPVTGRVKVYE